MGVHWPPHDTAASDLYQVVNELQVSIKQGSL